MPRAGYTKTLDSEYDDLFTYFKESMRLNSQQLGDMRIDFKARLYITEPSEEPGHTTGKRGFIDRLETHNGWIFKRTWAKNWVTIDDEESKILEEKYQLAVFEDIMLGDDEL